MKDRYSLKQCNVENVLAVLLLLFLVLWRIPFLNKGIDYTDTGFSMENYKNMFLGEGIQGIGRFYTVVLGGFLYKLLPAYHLLVYRVLHWLLNLVTYFFAYKIFEKHLNKNLILIGLIAVSFSAKVGEAMFSYYPLSVLLLVASIWALVTAVEKNSLKFFMLSGFICGINTFVRLPNVLYFSIILGVIAYFVATKTKRIYALKAIGYYILGAFISLGVTIGLMIAVMGFNTVVDSFMGYVRLALGKTTPGVENFLGIDEVSKHSLFATFFTVAVQIWKCVKLLVILVPVAAVNLMLSYLTKITQVKKIIVNSMIITVDVIIFWFFRQHLEMSVNHTMYLSALFIAFFSVILFFKKKPELMLINLVVILTSLCSVLGSDAGLSRMNITSSMLILLLVIGANSICQLCMERTWWIKGTADFFKSFSVVAIVAVYVVGVFIYIPKTYNDADFIELNYPVNHEIVELRGMKTSKERSAQINEYYEIMSTEELSNKEVAIFGYFPLGIVIGDQKDYFEPVQPCIDYPGVSVTKLLKNIQEKDEMGITPIIVTSYVHMQQNNTESFTSEAKIAVLNYMLSLYDYEIYSNTENFTVYIPKEN